MNAETQTVELCKTDELSENTEENYEDYIDRGIPTTWHIRVYKNLSYTCTFRIQQECPP